MEHIFFNNNDKITALDAQKEAQKIAFGPVVFQVIRTMRDFNVLKELAINKKGSTYSQLAELTNLSKYAIQVLCESALSAGVVIIKENKVFLSKTGFYLYSDELTIANMDYNHHVNYKGLFYLDESIKNSKPEGLKVFGDWDTIYPALSSLPEDTKRSWFNFDHLYSDSAFPFAVKKLLKLNPKSILDIGGNTGKFSSLLAKENKNIDITIMDLPSQIKLAKQNIYANDIQNISLYEANILSDESTIPKGFDIIWMSQFLDCFKEDQIIYILKKIKESMSDTSEICIMEPFWDRQINEAGAYCVINTSPYFTAMANGYSKMFKYTDFIEYIEKAGLSIIESIDNIGICQTIIRCK
ncbi:MAG: class I SAM-dependent methyltransferase [Campylobacterales bacterium]|nr:class I SAM-dependent methyltransferase [Campylobacterales bacterium]